MRFRVRALLAMAMAIGAGTSGAIAAPSSNLAPARACADLQRTTIPATLIGEPSGAAVVTAATAEEVRTPHGEAMAYCRVLGSIAPLSASASPILFEVNLPTAWNGRSLMMGGGGFNGTLTSGLGQARDQPDSEPTPLARGYVTFGTDSGHEAHGPRDDEPARFALDDEMLRNFAYASYKKVSDVAAVLIRAYYGRPAQFRYFLGGSEGGREGLTMAQRYPADFDGVISVVPVIYWTGLINGFVNIARPQYEGGAFGPEKVRLVADAVNAACDGLDGIADGVVSNYLACARRFSLSSLRCPDGGDAGDGCLSDAQLAVLRAAYGPSVLPFPLASGASNYPGRLFGGEIEPGAAGASTGDGIGLWLTAGAPPARSPHDAVGVLFGSNYVRFVITRDPNYDVRRYDPAQFEARVKAVSELMDSTNPDLSAFQKRGGKLIMRENAGDMAQSPLAGIRYYDKVVARMGQSAVNKFVRLYVSPASAHSGLAASLTTGALVPTRHDLLPDLDRWVSTGVPPGDALVQVRTASSAPYDVEAARPMCRYPAYPRYVSGDPKRAESYRCERSAS